MIFDRNETSPKREGFETSAVIGKSILKIVIHFFSRAEVRAGVQRPAPGEGLPGQIQGGGMINLVA
jgi:hypothetical protein